jgi:hypothetical protein
MISSFDVVDGDLTLRLAATFRGSCLQRVFGLGWLKSFNKTDAYLRAWSAKNRLPGRPSEKAVK